MWTILFPRFAALMLCSLLFSLAVLAATQQAWILTAAASIAGGAAIALLVHLLRQPKETGMT